MNPQIAGVETDGREQESSRRPGRSGVRLRGQELRLRMNSVGITGLELARKARLGEATVSRAVNGRPVQPATLRAIAKALAELDPIPGVDGLIEHNDNDGEVVR